MPLLSGWFDFALAAICVVIAVWAARAQNDFLFTGLIFVAVAAFAGGFNLGGWTQFAPTHEWLSQLGRGPGTLAMGLGVLAAVFGPWPSARWWAVALAIVGVGAVHALQGSPHFELVLTLWGSTLLVALLIAAVQALRLGRAPVAGAALGAITLLVVVGFAVNRIPLPEGRPLKHVDLLHLMLMACYGLIWFVARDFQRLRGV
ncbi:MAG: hypothetical protein K1X74_15940 [Pirellulales bacterium]|nr:hypothetical protein [Pirellulales bacterium]